jgi:hypothetical protein
MPSETSFKNDNPTPTQMPSETPFKKNNPTPHKCQVKRRSKAATPPHPNAK